ncbi:adenosine deaminase [Aureimonas endophytica]|uniref:Adenine deaminase n=1 Tax=Aureimonas endophytica TaxID=2027858 RepID=A0A916ZQM9_9HYPH|nr:adenosine deaminase [Aureimonas endophytica]GGE09575.1 adenosine deaminase [Aureimonas endophytica]
MTPDRLARLPKAELHCHLEGTASPALVQRQAARHGVDVSDILADGAYRRGDFQTFLRAYDRASALFRTEEDYAELTRTYLAAIAAEGAFHAELFVSPDHARAAGLAPRTYIGAVAAGAARAEADHGIVCRLIVVGVRHFGVAAVEAAARFAAEPGLPRVSGFGLAGDETVGRPADFARAFAIAGEAGLGLTAHAGEFAGPDAVRETLDALKPSRLGHGVRAVEDRELLRRIAAEGVVLEVCPGSNLALGVYPSPAAHPLRRLVEAGCRVTVNSDDPPFFATSLAAEYAFARDRQGLAESVLAGFTRTAIEAAFVDKDTRRMLEERFVAALLALGSGPGSD